MAVRLSNSCRCVGMRACELPLGAELAATTSCRGFRFWFSLEDLLVHLRKHYAFVVPRDAFASPAAVGTLSRQTPSQFAVSFSALWDDPFSASQFPFTWGWTGLSWTPVLHPAGCSCLTAVMELVQLPAQAHKHQKEHPLPITHSSGFILAILQYHTVHNTGVLHLVPSWALPTELPLPFCISWGLWLR